MNFKFCLSISILFCLFFQLSAQEVTYTENINEHFVIKEHNFLSQRYVDSLEAKWAREPDTTDYSKLGITPPPPPPPIAVLDFNHSIHFIARYGEIIEYKIVDDLQRDTVSFPYLYRIIKIDRETKEVSYFYPGSFQLWEGGKYAYYEEDRFVVLEEHRDIRKEILGYDCFKVTGIGQWGILEMYVTEDIRLEYHPIIKVKPILDKYFPLYIYSYDKEYPTERFLEFTFHRCNCR